MSRIELQEQADREMALQLQQAYETEYSLAAATNEMYRADGGPPQLRTSKSVAIEVMSSMISMPYSVSPTSSAGIQFREESRRSSINDTRRPSGTMERYPSQDAGTYANGPLPLSSPGETPIDIETNRRVDSIFRKNRSEDSRPIANDFILARALQAMEFEIADETLLNRNSTRDGTVTDESFGERELQASSCKRQMLTISTVICLVQILFLVSMIQQDGYASRSLNPMIGPPATTLVRYGAKYAGFIVHKKQWWRLISPIAIHAGIIHLISNVVIQLRVGGYLNLVYGTGKWFTIYLFSGIFGEVISCIVLPGSVGVGSSGAVLGMLASWIVWIIYRWKKIPAHCHRQRNCQLFVVVLSVVVTLATSFAPYVDWGAHLGGAAMGTLLGMALLSDELDNKRHAMIIRIVCWAVIISLFFALLYYVAVKLNPTEELIPYFLQNDDWHSHK